MAYNGEKLKENPEVMDKNDRIKYNAHPLRELVGHTSRRALHDHAVLGNGPEVTCIILRAVGIICNLV